MRRDISLRNDDLIRKVVREQILLNNKKSNLDVLSEGIAGDLAQDAIQFAVAAAAEYGLGTLTLPAYGAGVAVGPASEFIVDAAFAAKEVADGVQAISDVTKSAGEFAVVLNAALNKFGGDFDAYYESLKEVVRVGIEKLAKGDTSKLDEIVEGMKKAVSKMVAEIVDPLEQAVKLIIPDATIGLGAAKAVGAVIKTLADNAYSALTTAIQSVDMLNDAITNPGKVIEFFKDVLAQLAEMLNSVGEYLNEMSWAKALMIGGPVTGTMLKKLGPDGMTKLSEMLAKATPEIISVVEAVVKKVVPALFAALGIYQILTKEEYKDQESGDKKEETEETKSESILRITKSQLKEIIYETFQSYHVGMLPGDRVVNVNPTCKHFQSRGVVDHIKELPEEQGKVAVYITTNSGDNWDEGEILEKTIDQLEPGY